MADLKEFLGKEFEKAGGEIPFEEFMSLALYAPEWGYYSANIQDVGNGRGDFATSATISGGMSTAIADWIRREMEFFEWRGPVSLVEMGAGGGQLAVGVLKKLGWSGRRKTNYHIVEVSGPLRQRQRESLGRRGSRVFWHDSVRSALSASGGRALLFSNELVDAFPAKWLRWNGGKKCWEEVFVSFDPAGGLREVFRDPEEDCSLYAFSATKLRSPSDGQRIEIVPSYRRWLKEVADDLVEGAMLTVDYGGSAGENYSRRPGGTMRAYYRNQRLGGGDIYQRFGKQDLTFDVNFDDLRDWGEEFGMETAGLKSQAAFLESSDLMAVGEVGQAFQVLHQRKL